MFGLISEKKLIENAVEIYRLEETSEAFNHDDFMFRCGIANALKSLCARLGINLTAYVKADKEDGE